MKKLLLLIVVLFSVISCTEEVTFNNPSFQGVKDNVFWRAIDSKATVALDGSLTIQGFSGTEIITLKTTSTAAQTYLLGINDEDSASYVKTEGNANISFATGTDVGNGQIVITEYDTVNNTITGTFKFNAENTYDDPLAGPILNFQQGVFYKVAVTPAVQ